MALNASVFSVGHADNHAITIHHPYQLRRWGIETKLVIGGQAVGEQDQSLIEVIAKARSWYHGLKSGTYLSIKDLAEKENLDRGDVSRILPLAFLAPTIIQDVLKGQQPAELTLDSLQRSTPNLPIAWAAQRAYLGFA